MINPHLTTYESKVLSALMRSKDPCAASFIAKFCGLQKVRGLESTNVRKIIESLRAQGYPIGQSSAGYFYCRTERQLTMFIFKLKQKVEQQNKLIKSLQLSFKNVGVNPEDVIGKLTVSAYVKNDDGTVGIRRFEVDAAGLPVIPPGTILA